MRNFLEDKFNYALIIITILSLISFHSFLPYIGVLATIPVIYSGLRSVIKRKISVDLLASIALTVSIIHHEWYSVAFINLMITSARIFGNYTESQAKTAVQKLLKLRPTHVTIRQKDSLIKLPLEQVKVGMEVVVKTGDRIPVDGKIIEGYGEIDESSLTGESLPLHKKINDLVLSSTLNLSGSFIVSATSVGPDTQFEKIIQLIAQAQNEKVGIHTLVDNFTTWYILATSFIATLLYISTHNLSLVLSLLLVTCADDIAVAIPLAYWGAIAVAAKHGIIIKGADTLEAFSSVKTLLVDKTGTLTRGKIKVNHLIPFAGYRHKNLLHTVASIESISHHPVALAVVQYATENKIKITPPQKFNEVPGLGITAKIANSNYLVGKLDMMKHHQINIPSEVKNQIKRIESEGHNLILVAKNKKIIGLVGLGDELRPNIRYSLTQLKQLGVSQVIMLTGDNPQVAKTIATQAGITQYHSNLLPAQKLEYVRHYLNPESKVAFVGDGVNDSAALTLADIGIAMGAIGSDSAIEAADVALMDDNFYKIPQAVSLSRHLKTIVYQDFAIWALVNSFGLFLVFTRVLNPATAAAYNFITDFIPLLNSLRIFRYKFNPDSILKS